MTVEKDRKTVPDSDDNKAAAAVSTTSGSSTSLSVTGRRGQYKVIDSTFDTTEDPRYYKPMPEYEGIHRWDPDFEWTEEEEKKVVRKVCPKSACLRCIGSINVTENAD
jgi:hypothetical protein